MTPLVYLHGLGGVSDGDPLVTALTGAGFEVVAPLSPGFRELEELDEIRDVHDLALHYDDLLVGLGLESVAVVGHSFGGMVAAELAAHVPYRVSKLVLAAPFGLWRDDQPTADLFTAFPLEIQDLLWTDAQSEAAQRAMATMTQGSAEADDPLVSMLITMVKGLTTVGKFIWPIPDKGLERRLHRITADTVLVWGAKDKLVPASHAELFAAKIGGTSRVEVLDDAGHMAPFEKLDEFVALVKEHMG